MKKKVIIVLAAVGGLAVAGSEAAAQGTPYFKAPVGMNGTGCGPSDDISITGENSAEMTIKFTASKFDAGNGKPSASGNGRSSCNFAVPIHVPSGFQVSLLTADWTGFAEGETEFSRRYFFAGRSVPPVTSKPESGKNFTYTDGRLDGSYSKCGGGDVQFRINSGVWAKSNPSHILIQMGTFRLKWQKCQ
ncbi:DUF4360 domain-containing protein [Candidatus Electronema sp. TJ]|uniref:DUF4360 domain-containing protein n=1 Tax=Candidatus Electronema sp. TJ TaxID=3401573 RepID=UPI003AA8A4CF